MPELPDVVVYLESPERCVAKARGIGGAVILKSPAGTWTVQVSKELPSGCRQEYNRSGETERG